MQSISDPEGGLTMPDDGAPSRSVVPLNVGGRVAAIVPHSFEEAFRVAKALSASGMTPKEINTPEKCLAIIMAGAEIGMPPFQSLQSFALINGRPALWGDGMLAIVLSRGVDVDERFEGEGDTLTAICKVTRPDTRKAVERRFSMLDAKTAGLLGKVGPWTQYRSRMLQMRARAWAIRDGCADILRGIAMAEEAQDIPTEAHVVETPQIEREFVSGAEAKQIVTEQEELIASCDTVEQVDALWEEIRADLQGRFSNNRLAGLEEKKNQRIHELREAGFRNGLRQSDPFLAEAMEPTKKAAPIQPKKISAELLLEELLACDTPDQVKAWASNLPSGLPPEEVANLRLEYASKLDEVTPK